MARNVAGQTWNGDLVALSLADGAPVWKVAVEEFHFEHSRGDSPAVHDGRLCFGGRDGKVYAVDGESGEVLWTTDLECGISTTPVVGRTGIYVGGDDGQVRLLAEVDGQLVAVHALQGPFGQSALVGDRLILMADEYVLAAIGSELDSMVWSRQSGSGWTTPQPLVWKNLVIAGDAEGNVFGYRIEDGSLAWTIGVKGKVRGLGSDGDMLLVGTLPGEIIAFEVGRDD